MELTDQPVPRRWIDVHAARFRALNWALVHVLHSSSVIDKGDMSVRWRRPRMPDGPVRRVLNLLVACVLPVLFPQGICEKPSDRSVGWMFHPSITPKATPINPPTGSLHRCICLTGGCGQCQTSALDASAGRLGHR